MHACVQHNSATHYNTGTNGYMAYLANRGDDMEMRHIKVSFDLGRTRFVFYSPRDRESIKEVIADADIVVNMVGKYYESGQPVQTKKFPYINYETNYSFHDANVLIPQTLAEICTEMQVDNFVHVSSASASPDSKSEWSRTKYEGELAVKEAYPWATIIRPTQLYGKQDRLLNWFARMAQWYRMVPLVDGGKSLIQPVWVGDVAKTILRVCDDPTKFQGKQIDCFGPTDYTYSELAKFVNGITERERRIFNLPYDIYSRLAVPMQYQREPLITPDLVEQWTEDFLPQMTAEQYKMQADNGDKIYTMQDLGIEAMPIEKEAFDYLHHYRVGGHFYKVQGYH
jgi:NADH dehydrogenase (ubiquinone) 1 alpha subcomplex subunit 9